MYGVVLTWNYLMVTLPVFLVGRLSGLDNETDFLQAAVIYMVMLSAMYLPARKFLRSTVEPFLTMDSGAYWKYVWYIPITMFLAAFVAFPGNSHITDAASLISRVLLGVAMVMICNAIAEDHKRMLEKKVMFQQLADQKLYYADLQTQVEELRKLRHDIKHHLSAIGRMADAQDWENLQEYCTSLQIRNTTKANIPYTGNAAADGILYRYMQLARENDIEFGYMGSITSSGIQDIDLCVLLGNALDNALEGCLTVDQGRQIQVVMQSEEQMICVVVRNSFDGKVSQKKGRLLSRKRQSAPGIGQASMQSVCEQYGGSITFDWDEQNFTVMFMLPKK